MIMKKEYLTSKKGEPLRNCQDAYEINDEFLRYAVADGATREYFSAKLAKELVNRFCFDEDIINRDIFNNKKYEEWLEPIQKNWLTYIEDIIKNKEVNFVVKNRFHKQHSGASTFVGLELDRENLIFKAIVIGDSCLFHIRDKEIVACYLIDDYQEFDNSPDFFFSRDFILNDENMIEKREFTKPNIVVESFEDGDYFLLATDAISKWLLTQKHKGKWEKIWNNLLKEDKDWYDNLIGEYREDKDNKLDDDDVTILILSTNDSDELVAFLDKSIENVKEEKKKIGSIDCYVEKDMEYHENLEMEKETQPIFLLMYKKGNTQNFRVLKSYLKEKLEEKGFEFISKKGEQKINELYEGGIIFLDYTHFDQIDSGIMNSPKCFTFYKFSNKDLKGYEFDEDFNTYVQKLEDVFYDDIWNSNKLQIILSEY